MPNRWNEGRVFTAQRSCKKVPPSMLMKPNYRPNWGLLLAGVLLATAARADDAIIGYVKTAQGQAMVLEAGKLVLAAPGTPIHLDNVLRTGKDGSMGVTFKDNTILSLGPDTELVVDTYVYQPAKDELSLGARMAKGSLNYVSGVIAKLKPEAVMIRTPSGNIGVRGTHFVLSVVED
jgi:hypothetical protein